MKILLIIIGGAIGAIARYGVSGLFYRFSEGIFPIGTLSVNLIGSFLFGFLWEFLDRSTASPEIRAFIFIGFIGSFTTFSTYSHETFNLMREGEMGLAIYNILLSNIGAIALVFLGFAGARYIFALFR